MPEKDSPGKDSRRTIRPRLVVGIVLTLLLVPVIAYGVFALLPTTASFVVVSGSMEPAIDAGSVVYVADTDNYAEGDVITFTRNGRTVTHRVVGETEGGYVTKGDANEDADGQAVQRRDITGEVVFSLPLYGYVFVLASAHIEYLFLIVVPAILLVALRDEVRG